MGIKVEWDNKNKEFYVKTDSNGRRTVKKSSVAMTAYLRSITDANFTWSRAAKKQIDKGL